MRIGRIIRKLRTEEHIETYTKKNRFIPNKTHRELKRIKKCQHCGEKHEKLQIHHITPIRKGGTNKKENLMVVCTKCHQKLDKEQAKQENSTKNKKTAKE